MRIGVIGYSGQAFDPIAGRMLVQTAFNSLWFLESVEIVSGLTRLGIPAIAYEEAVRRGWRTVGIACAQAANYECFPVDEAIIVGNDWGDESQTLLAHVQMLIRIGGGHQAHQEIQLAKAQGKWVLEFELPTLVAS